MNLVFLTKVLNLVSLIFIPCSYFFSILGFDNKSGILYVWLCICGFLINYLNKKKSKLFIIPSIAIFAPIVLSKNYTDALCIGFYGFVVIVLVLKGMNYLKYTVELDMFRKGLFIIGGTFVISLMGGIGLFTTYSTSYILIYLVSAILLLRNLRFYEYNTEKLEGTKVNRVSSVLLIVAAFVLSLESVRNAVVEIIKKTYLFIIDKLLYLTSWLIIWLGNILGTIITSIINFIRKLLGYNQVEFFKNSPLNIFKPKQDDNKALINNLIENKYFIIIMKVLIIVVIALILIKLLKGLVNSQSNTEDYIEEKEYISKEGVDEKPRRNIFEFLKPKTDSQKIRLLYQKYMHVCINNDINLSETDTTEDINLKSKSILVKII